MWLVDNRLSINTILITGLFHKKEAPRFSFAHLNKNFPFNFDGKFFTIFPLLSKHKLQRQQVHDGDFLTGNHTQLQRCGAGG